MEEFNEWFQVLLVKVGLQYQCWESKERRKHAFALQRSAEGSRLLVIAFRRDPPTTTPGRILSATPLFHQTYSLFNSEGGHCPRI